MTIRMAELQQLPPAPAIDRDIAGGAHSGDLRLELLDPLRRLHLAAIAEPADRLPRVAFRDVEDIAAIGADERDAVNEFGGGAQLIPSSTVAALIADGSILVTLNCSQAPTLHLAGDVGVFYFGGGRFSDVRHNGRDQEVD